MSDLFLPEYQNVAVVLPGERTGKGGNPHHYMIGGMRYARVTTALNVINKPALIGWAKRISLDKVRQTLTDLDVELELCRMVHESEEGMPTTVEYQGWVDRLIQAASDRPDEVRDATAALGTSTDKCVGACLERFWNGCI